jgi:DNA-binding beta-propeller fold protein YncE
VIARRARWLAALAIVVAACAEDPVAPPAEDVTPPENLPPSPPRVLVVNSLSWTLSSLDPDTGTMTVQAATLGAVPNRVTAASGGRELLVTVSGDNEVTILAAHDLSRRGGIDVGRGSNPWLAVALPTGSAIVSNWLSSDVRRLDLAARAAGPALDTSPGPEGLAVLDGFAWIACTNYLEGGGYGEGRVDVVDLAQWRVVSSVPVGKNPQEVLVDAAGRVHVLCTGTYGTGPDDEPGSVWVVDPAARAVVDSAALGGSPGRFALDGDGVVWVCGEAGGVRRYRADDLSLLTDPVDRWLRSPGLTGIAVDPSESTVWITSFDADVLLAVDPSTVSVRDAWFVGDGPVDVLVVRVSAARRTARART